MMPVPSLKICQNNARQQGACIIPRWSAHEVRDSKDLHLVNGDGEKQTIECRYFILINSIVAIGVNEISGTLH
jgi:hypothetical protein